MDYAAVLYLDKETEAYFSGIITAIAESGAGSYMTDNNAVPHITVADFHTDNIGIITDKIDNNIASFAAGGVIWASLGAFVPRVLFAAPVMNEYLLNTCINANRLIKPFAPHCGYGQYLPYQWVPHTTLASRLDGGSLRKAFDVAARLFTARKGKCVKLSLIQCSPVKEIRSWDLQ
jgi:hypothetical protein